MEGEITKRAPGPIRYAHHKQRETSCVVNPLTKISKTH